LSLSGTPIENSLSDLWSQMQFINPDILLDYPKFKKMYQDPIQLHKDEAALDELKKLLNPFILRRTKKDVLNDLPDMEEFIHYCEMEEDQKTLIETEKSKARNSLIEMINEDKAGLKINILNALMKLRQMANHPQIVDKNSDISSCKYIEVTNTIDTLVKAKNKMLIFSSFVSHLDIYAKFCEENGISYQKLTGSDHVDKRRQAVDCFNNDEDCFVFLISIKAGGTGLNLTAASYVLILDPWWNPFIEEQAKARAHRIGQKQNVTVIKFITKDTIEEKILTLQSGKLKLATDFMEETDVVDLDDDVLSLLLN
jgi:SNF2 family DNA or RNA helicase